MDVPVFDYCCSDCGMTHEVIVLAGEEPPSSCPACSGPLQRRWSRVGVQLVGWGFARNDAMLSDSKPRRPFRTIRDKASELFD